MNTRVRAVSFVARSGTGKTTLVEQVITILQRRGRRVGALKHDAHRFDIDYPGKDSYRFTAAGAEVMLICSAEQLALVRRHVEPPQVEELLARYFADMDIVLVEGFTASSLPKIEVHRAACGTALLCRGSVHDATLCAVASDVTLEADVPCLDLNNPAAVADFIEMTFLA